CARHSHGSSLYAMDYW
nr:immunoglobulin heavy chain junction region [Mus musculus]